MELKPITPAHALQREIDASKSYEVELVSAVVGMGITFIRKVVGKKDRLSEQDVLALLDQDAFGETFVPRSKVLFFLRAYTKHKPSTTIETNKIHLGDALELMAGMPEHSIQAVITSSPYWAMRIYDNSTERTWADGEKCAFGLESTPEGFIRHSVEVLFYLKEKLKENGSIWWNIMDTFNTRTQLRSNAAETLRAYAGKDGRAWKEHEVKRYSAGHSYLKDGEQCMIPQRIYERAARLGYYCKSYISWCKTSCMPEPQKSRVSRNVEYILHLSVERTPKFNKGAYLTTQASLGGRQTHESKKLSDFWYLPSSSGQGNHGAQFPLQLTGRCIVLSSDENDVILDPFMGSGTTAVAATLLKRKFIGFELSAKYIGEANEKLKKLLDGKANAC